MKKLIIQIEISDLVMNALLENFEQGTDICNVSTNGNLVITCPCKDGNLSKALEIVKTSEAYKPLNSHNETAVQWPEKAI